MKFISVWDIREHPFSGMESVSFLFLITFFVLAGLILFIQNLVSSDYDLEISKLSIQEQKRTQLGRVFLVIFLTCILFYVILVTFTLIVVTVLAGYDRFKIIQQLRQGECEVVEGKINNYSYKIITGRTPNIKVKFFVKDIRFSFSRNDGLEGSYADVNPSGPIQKGRYVRIHYCGVNQIIARIEIEDKTGKILPLKPKLPKRRR
jgi:hypothetical protein